MDFFDKIFKFDFFFSQKEIPMKIKALTSLNNFGGVINKSSTSILDCLKF